MSSYIAQIDDEGGLYLLPKVNSANSLDFPRFPCLPFDHVTVIHFQQFPMMVLLFSMT